MKPLGIWTDGDPKNNPENTSRFNLNANINAEKGAITNEQSFEKVISLPPQDLVAVNPQIIGRIRLNDNKECIISVNDNAEALTAPDAPGCEIGILTPEGEYQIVLRDNAQNVPLHLSKRHLIQGTYKINFQGDTIIYFTDDFNQPRWLNLTRPQVTLSDNPSVNYKQLTSIDELNKMALFAGRYLSNPEVIEVAPGGNLKSGVIYVGTAYLSADYAPTKAGFFTNPIPITFDTAIGSLTDFQGDPAGTVTDKKITIKIPAAELDPSFSYIKVYVLYKNNGALSAYEFSPVAYSVGNDFIYDITSLDNAATSSVESALALPAMYDKAKTITQLDNTMYLANLENTSEISLQPYVNNIVLDYTVENQDLSTAPVFKDGVICATLKGLMWDEVYSIMISVTYTNGQESKAYHIPGRPAFNMLIDSTPFLENAPLSDLNTLLNPDYFNGGVAGDLSPAGQIYRIDNSAKIFHAFNTADNSNAINIYGAAGLTSNMGYWENANEVYPDTDDWDIKDSFGNIITSLRNLPVRHHKMPHPQESASKMHLYQTPTVGSWTGTDYPITSPANYQAINILGIKLKNITLPAELTGKVAKINIYYTKRDAINRTILAQSVTIPGSAWHSGNTTDGESIIIGGPGNFQIQNIQRYATTGGPLDLARLSTFTPSPIKNIAAANLPVNAGGHGYNKTYDQGTQYYNYVDVSADPWLDDDKDYYCFDAFDLLAYSTSVNSATYVKNLFKIKSRYTQTNILGDCAYGSPTTDFGIGFLMNPGNYVTEFYGIENVALPNKIRSLNARTYIPEEYPGGIGTFGSNAPFDTFMNVENYGGELKVLLEYQDKLLVGSTPADLLSARSTYSIPNPGTDYAILDFFNNTELGNVAADGYMTASMYLSNLCIFKSDMYINYSSLEVVYTGTSLDIDPSMFANYGTGGYDSTVEVYGGDTFTTRYGVRSKIDLGKFTYTDVNERLYCTISTIHSFICQSASNINMRYEGETATELFYPKSSATEVNSIPVHTAPVSNYIAYNKDYSSLNDIRQPVINGLLATPQIFDFPDRIIRSGEENTESIQDNFRVFAAGDYYDLSKDKGEITVLQSYNNKLIAHVQKALITTLGRERIQTTSVEAYVSAGDIFAVKPRDLYPTDSGYLGSSSQWAGIVTPFGYIFPDINTGRIFQFNELGEPNLQEISSKGLFTFFRNNLAVGFKDILDKAILDSIPAWTTGAAIFRPNSITNLNGDIYKWVGGVNSDFTNIPGSDPNWILVYTVRTGFYTDIDNTVYKQGTGLTAAFDYRYNRYILSKKDYIVSDGPNGAFRTYFKGMYSRNQFFTPSTYTTGDVVFYNGVIYTLTISETTIPDTFLIDSFTNVDPVYIYGVPIDLENDEAGLFIPRFFTIAYYPEYQVWASWYNYYPNLLFSNQQNWYISKGSSLYTGNSETDTGRFFDKAVQEPFVLEPLFNEASNTVKHLVSVEVDTKATQQRLSTLSANVNSYLNFSATTKDYLKTFTSHFVYDSYQISTIQNIVNQKTARNAEGYWNINTFRDMTLDNSKPLFVNNWIYSAPNTQNINANKHWSKQKRFVDYWFGMRLIYDQMNVEEIHYTSSTIESTSQFSLTLPDRDLLVNDIVYVTMEAEPDNITVTALITAIEVINGITYYTIDSTDLDPLLNIHTIKARVPLNLYLFDASPRMLKNTR